jgi:hypothetical protein
VLLILGTNKQPSKPKLTNTHNGNLHGLLLVLHRSDRWPAPVRPVDRADQVGGYRSLTTNVPEILNDFSRPWNKNTLKTQLAQKKNSTQKLGKHLQTNQPQPNPKTHRTSNSLESNPIEVTHRSNRSIASVTPGQLRMNSTRGSTPPNPTPDLPIRSTDSNKTLGIVGTPHGHSIAKLWSTKTC